MSLVFVTKEIAQSTVDNKKYPCYYIFLIPKVHVELK